VSPTPDQTYPDTFGIAPDIYNNRKRILAVLCLSLVLIVVAVSSLNVAIPTIQQALDASPTQIQWIIDSYALVFAGFLLPAGAIGDRFGRKGALLTGLAIFGTCALAASFAKSPGQLIAARSFMGIGAALVMPATLSIIQNSFPPHERAKAVATWAGLAGAGGAIGPLLSGLMLKFFGWSSVFFINIPLVILLGVLAMVFVPTSRDPEGHPLDPIGSLLSVIALVALVFGIIEGPEWGWASAGVIGSIVVAGVAGVAFVAYENRIEYPTLDPKLFKLRGFGMGSLAITTIFFAMFGMFFLSVQYLQYVHGYSPLESGVRSLPSAFVLISVSPRSPLITARFGIRRTLRTGFVLAALGLVGMATLDVDSSYLHFMFSLIVMAAGIALVMPPSTSSIISSLPLSKSGVGSAVNDVTREVGGAVGIAVMGSILNTLYRSHIDLSALVSQVPPENRARFLMAEEGIGPAAGVAKGLTESAKSMPPEIGTQLAGLAGKVTAASKDAFVSGASVAFGTAAVIISIVGVFASFRIPDELGEQTAEVGDHPGPEDGLNSNQAIGSLDDSSPTS